MSQNFVTCFHGALPDLLELLNGSAPMTLEEHRAVLANLAGKLSHLERAVERMTPRANVCAMAGCDDPIHRDGSSSGAFCAVHERELREEEGA